MKVFHGTKVDAIPNSLFRIIKYENQRTDCHGALILARVLYLCQRHKVTKVYSSIGTLSDHFQFSPDQVRRALARLRTAKFLRMERDKAGWRFEPLIDNIGTAIELHNEMHASPEISGDDSVSISATGACGKPFDPAQVRDTLPAYVQDTPAGTPYILIQDQEFKKKNHDALTLSIDAWLNVGKACEELARQVEKLNIPCDEDWLKLFRSLQSATRRGGMQLRLNGKQVVLFRIDPMMILTAIRVAHQNFEVSGIREVCLTIHTQEVALRRMCEMALPSYSVWRREWSRISNR